MNIERLARKLEPLMPREVRHWLRVRDSADPDLRSLIDKQIIENAHDKLGDFRRKILLSLPPERVAAGSFHLGNVTYDKERWSFGLSEEELLQNLAIYGRSGSGKTNIAFHLLEQINQRKVPFLFLDWKRTARHLIPHLQAKVNVYTPGRQLSPLHFNPFVPPPGMEPNVYLNHVIDVMAEAFTLGEGSKRVVQRAIAACYAKGNVGPSVNDVLNEVTSMDLKDRAGGWKVTALRALESLSLSHATSNGKVSQEEMIAGLLRGNTVIELDGLDQSVKKFLVPLLCLWLYYCRLGSASREKLSLVVFVEEAHHVLYKQERRAKEALMNMLLRQCRELGMAFIVIDQHPHLISSAAMGNTYTSICLNQKDPSDISKAAALSLLDESEKRFLSMLPVGQGIVKLQDRWRRPFLVKFPLIEIEKGWMTDDRLRRYLASEKVGSAAIGVPFRDFEQVRRIQHPDIPLNEAALQFIEDVVVHLDDGVKQRYQRLGWSVGKGNDVKQALVSDGWLDEQTVEMGMTRRAMLRLSADGKARLGFPDAKAERASLAHEYWKRFYEATLQKQGYHVQIEVERRGGRVDILAERDGRQVAVEVETGSSSFVQNVRNCLRSHFDHVIVVATTRMIRVAIEQALAREGLLIPSRVQVILAGEDAVIDSSTDADNIEDDSFSGDDANGEEVTATDEGNDAGD